MAISVRLSAIAAGFVTVVLFGIAWIAGIVGSFATYFHNSSMLSATTAISLIIPSDGLWRAASFSMQPAIVRATEAASNTMNPLVPAAPPPIAFFVWCLFWFAVVLIAGTISFQRRDI